MGLIKTKGVVLQEANSGDYDKVLTILTPDLGKIICFAKNARKPNNAFLAGSSLFAFSDIILFKGSGSYKLNTAETIEVFYNLRTNWDKLNIASKITQIVKDVTYEGQQVYRILQLYLNTLYIIAESDKDENYITSIFKLRLISLLGFTPEVEKCVSCSEKENLELFSFKDNGVKCRICSKQDKGGIEITHSTLEALNYIVKCNPKQIYNIEIGDEELAEINLISKIYFNEKLEKKY